MNEIRVAVMLEDFFEGRTTVEDEALLYGYFCSDNVSPLFTNYIPLFRGLDAAGNSRHDGRKQMLRKICWWSVSVAAMLTLVVTLGRGIVSDADLMNDTFALYDGSYVIEDGHKITDLSVIMNRLHRAEASAETMISRPQMNVPTEGLDDEMQHTISEILNY